MLKNNVKILVEKTQLDQDLNKFAQTTIKLWQYYQIKTYKNKIIFKMKQSDFNKLGDLAEEGKVSLWYGLNLVFKNFFRLFNNEELDFNIWPGYNRQFLS